MKKKLFIALIGMSLILMTACGESRTIYHNINSNSDSLQTKSDENNQGIAETDTTEVDVTEADIPEENTAESKAREESADAIRPEFKEAMDSYEAFYNEYCDVIKKYTANPSDIRLLADYTNMLSKSAEMAEKFDAWENDDMNSEELKYYLDVNNRITKKLLEVYE